MLEAVRLCIAVVALAVASAYDVRSRTVPSWLLLSFTAVEASLQALGAVQRGVPDGWPAYLAIDAMLVAAVWALAYTCRLGVGDALAYTGIVLAHPWGWRVLPLPLTTLLYTGATGALIMMYNVVANLADAEARRELARVPLAERVKMLLTARLVPVEEILAGSWWIPLLGDSVERVTCSEDIEPRDVLREAMERGVVEPRGRVWATYGMPFMLNILAGFTMALLLGDGPILAAAGAG